MYESALTCVAPCRFPAIAGPCGEFPVTKTLILLPVARHQGTGKKSPPGHGQKNCHRGTGKKFATGARAKKSPPGHGKKSSWNAGEGEAEHIRRRGIQDRSHDDG